MVVSSLVALSLGLLGCGGHTRGNAPGSGLPTSDPEATEPELSEPKVNPLIKISVGESSACVLHRDGRVACFAHDQGLQHASAPVAGTFRDIAGDASTGAALREDGSVATWGDAPPFPTGRLEQIAFNSLRGCGIRDDHAIACDGAAERQLALLMGNYQQLLVAGDGGVCGLTTDGALDCDAPTWAVLPPTIDLPPLREVAIDPTGTVGGCGIDLTGELHCWGYYCPIPGTFSHVSLSYFDACAITTQGRERALLVSDCAYAAGPRF